MNRDVISRLTEKDYVVFAAEGFLEIPRLFIANFVDDKWVYLRSISELEVNYKANRLTGEMRQFDRLGWTKIYGEFSHHCQE